MPGIVAGKSPAMTEETLVGRGLSAFTPMAGQRSSNGRRCSPGPGEVRVRQTAIGLNYIDVYSRTGFYPQPSLPFIPGMEAAGVITAIGEGVKDLKAGRRVAYAGPIGAYAE